MFDVGKHRRADEVSAVADTLAAGREQCALLLANIDVVKDALHLLFGNHRTQHRRAVTGIADPKCSRTRRQPFDHVVVDLLLDQHP